MFFTDILNMLDRAENLNEGDAWLFSVDDELKRLIITLNTEGQLFDKGIDSLGNTLGDYSAASVNVFGKRPGHIQLKDTGAFYRSFQVIVDPNGLTILADDESIYDEPLTDVYGIEILGLTEESLTIINPFMTDNFIEYAEQQLLQ